MPTAYSQTGLWTRGSRRELILSHDADDDTLNLDVLRFDEDRLHRGVGRLQADLAAGIAVQLLQRDVGSPEKRDHHLAVVGRFSIFDHHEVAVANLLVDHRIAANAEDVSVALAGEILGNGDGFVRR